MTRADKKEHASSENPVSIALRGATVEGNLGVPAQASGIVLFAHGSGSSRHSPRNRFVAGTLRAYGIATLLMDLLTQREEEIDEQTAELRFDIPLLAKRLVGATHWVLQQPELRGLRIGYFGASTGAAAALVAAAQMPGVVSAVVSRGGRPDLAGNALGSVVAPTLLLVGGNDWEVIALNEQAMEQLGCMEKKLDIVPGATHLFEEPGALEEVARRATDWFSQSFARKDQPQAQRSARAR
jgi:putative phosphoribosyl transferase